MAANQKPNQPHPQPLYPQAARPQPLYPHPPRPAAPHPHPHHQRRRARRRAGVFGLPVSFSTLIKATAAVVTAAIGLYLFFGAWAGVPRSALITATFTPTAVYAAEANPNQPLAIDHDQDQRIVVFLALEYPATPVALECGIAARDVYNEVVYEYALVVPIILPPPGEMFTLADLTAPIQAPAQTPMQTPNQEDFGWTVVTQGTIAAFPDRAHGTVTYTATVQAGLLRSAGLPLESRTFALRMVLSTLGEASCAVLAAPQAAAPSNDATHPVPTVVPGTIQLVPAPWAGGPLGVRI